MERIMNFENLRNFCYFNDGVCQKPIKGIVLSFAGLGAANQYQSDTLDGDFYGSNGLLYVYPYNNPWAWMNPQAVSFTDEILDVLFDRFDLPESTPIISTGGSMGGLAALVYCKYAKRTPVRCVANCPVCDTVFHFTERSDLPRTLYSAIWNFDGTLEEALKSISPLHLASQMPRIPYRIYHCIDDQRVSKARHSDRFVTEMKRLGHDVVYYKIPGRGHCDLPYLMKKQFGNDVLEAVGCKLL